MDGWTAWAGHIPFAHWLVKNIEPRVFVELGCFTGVSFSAFCDAVRQSRIDCRCYGVDTWEGDAHAGFLPPDLFPSLSDFVRHYFGSFATLLRKTFDEALADIPDGTVDLLHIDGLHSYEAVRHDFESWLPKLSEQAVVLFHDTAERREDFGVWRFWEEISSRYPGFAFEHSHGLGVLLVGQNAPPVARALCTESDPAILKLIERRFAYFGAHTELRRLMAVRDMEVDALRAEIGQLKQQLLSARPPG